MTGDIKDIEQAERNEFGDLILNDKLTIKQLYDIACKEGIENRILNIKMLGKKGESIGVGDSIVSVGKWWSKDSTILEVNKWYTPEELNGTGSCSDIK